MLAESLASVFGQLDATTRADVEVCLTDNASYDGTEELAADLMREHGGRFRYLRHHRDQGLAANLLSSVELARSDYCWILMPGDTIEAGGIARVLELIAQSGEPPGIVVRKTNFADPKLSAQEGPDFCPAEERRTLRYVDMDAFLGDCALLTSLVSVMIVRRKSWLEAEAEVQRTSDAAATLFPHLPITVAIARRDPGWIWCPGKLVQVRWVNATLVRDGSLGSELIHARVLEDLNKLWIRQLGPRSRVRLRIMRRAYRTFVVPKVLSAVAPEGRSLLRRAALLSAYTRIFWWLPEFWFRTVPALISGGSSRRGRRRTRPMPELPVEQRRARVSTSGLAAEVPNGHELTVQLEVTNCTPVTFSTDPPRRIVIGYRWLDADGEICLQGPAVPLPYALAPEGTLTCTVNLSTPSEAGSYELRFALAQEDVGWFDDRAEEFACRHTVAVHRYGWADMPIIPPRR